MNPKLTAVAADPRGRPGQRGLHRARLDLQLPRRARRAGGQGARRLPRPPGRRQRLVLGPGALRRAARADRDRRRAALVGARHADRGAGRDRRGRRAGHRPAALADPRARLRGRRRHASAFTTASDILGTAIGETLGYLLTATWTVLVIVALGRRYAGRWFQVLGAASAALVLVGVLSPLGLPVIDTANFFGYVLWSIWLIAFGVVILVHERRAASAPRPGRRRDRRGGAGRRWACCA